MPAVLSTLRNPGLCVVRKVMHFPTHTCIDFGDDTSRAGPITFQALLNSWKNNITPIPITTLDAMDLFTTGRCACFNEVNAKQIQTGLCVFVVALKDSTSAKNNGSASHDMWYASAICRCPELLTKLANSLFPRFVDSAEIKMLRNHGIDYQRHMCNDNQTCTEPAGFVLTKLIVIPEEKEECCICMDGTPTFRWSGCMHADGSSGALICLRCRNRINTSNSKANAKTKCPICRTEGTTIRHKMKT